MDKRIAKANLARLDRLVQGLESAITQLGTLFPLQPDLFSPQQLGPRDSLLLDGFRARFSDLQDMLGRTMFKTIALLDEDEMPDLEMTTKERIALMEKRGLLEGDTWQDIREVRNNFAHEYPDADAEKAANLNAAWQHAPVLLSVALAVTDYLRDKHGIVA
jgi:hypothetical protein